MDNFKLLQREPTLWLGVIYAVVTIGGTFGFAHFTGTNAALVNTAIAALFAAANAALVRPVSPVAFTYAIGALVGLAGSYGLAIPDATLAAVNGAVVPILLLLVRGQVTPVDTAVTRESTVKEKAREVSAAPTTE